MRVTRRSFLAAVPAAFVAACTRSRSALSARRTTSTVASTTTSTTRPRVSTARFVRTGPVSRAAVAFTFHGSGDRALLDELLAAADRAGAPITIFAVGNWLDADPTIAGAILQRGHELANHTYTHPSLGGLDRGAIATEITRCRDTLTRVAGGPGAWFRPSGIEVPTATMLEEAARAGYDTIVGYDVDPLDYQDPGRDAVVSRVTQGLHAGAIVSLHTGHAGTVAAFEAVVAAARQHGLNPVRVREMLA